MNLSRLKAQITCSTITRNMLSVVFRFGLHRLEWNQHLLFPNSTCLAFPILSFASRLGDVQYL
jgi:hypothetical protein